MDSLPPSNLPNRGHSGPKPSHKPSGGPREVWALGDDTWKSYAQNTIFYSVFLLISSLTRAGGGRAGGPQSPDGGRRARGRGEPFWSPFRPQTITKGFVQLTTQDDAMRRAATVSPEEEEQAEEEENLRCTFGLPNF